MHDFCMSKMHVFLGWKKMYVQNACSGCGFQPRWASWWTQRYCSSTSGCTATRRVFRDVASPKRMWGQIGHDGMTGLGKEGRAKKTYIPLWVIILSLWWWKNTQAANSCIAYTSATTACILCGASNKGLLSLRSRWAVAILDGILFGRVFLCCS